MILLTAVDDYRQRRRRNMDLPDEQPTEKRPLDRENLPPTFTADLLRHLLPRDLVWLERNAAALSTEQRDTFRSASKEMRPLGLAYVTGASTTRLGDLAKAAESKGIFREAARAAYDKTKILDNLVTSKNFTNYFHSLKVTPARAQRDVEIQQSLSELTATPPIHIPTDLAGKRHREQQEVLGQLNDQLGGIKRLLALLAERAEQEEREAELRRRELAQQKTEKWFFASVATASMVATFAAVPGSSRMWWALVAAWFAVAITYLVVHRGGPPDDRGSDDSDAPTQSGV